jgi:hypothetical protein
MSIHNSGEKRIYSTKERKNTITSVFREISCESTFALPGIKGKQIITLHCPFVAKKSVSR